MTDITFEELKQRLQPDNEKIHRVEITDEEIAGLSNEQAEELAAHFGGHALIMLPGKEREFYAWLRKEDPAIWEDLWEGDEEPYLVGIGNLPDLLPNRRGFLISDLANHQNYYFSESHITDDGRIYFDAALEIVKNNGKLSMQQAFVVEVWRAPIDQWRFAYMYNVPLATVKEMVQWLLNEGILTLSLQEKEDLESIDDQ